MADRDISFKATLKSLDRIEVFIPKRYNSTGKMHFYLYEDGEYVQELHIRSYSDSSKNYIFQLDELPILKLGSTYELFDERNVNFPINCSYLCRIDSYIDKYDYSGELGAIYDKKHTIFRVFSPIASECNVLLYDEKNNRCIASNIMNKNEEEGIFEIDVDGDLEGISYLYLLKINGEYISSIDPYARSVTKYSRRGVIIDLEKTKIDLNEDKLDKLDSSVDAIIYELNVRDITSEIDKNIPNTGKFLGLTYENLKTKKGLPIGLDYLASLGVSHIQLLPIFDFISINDNNPESSYNWGYDPINYNSPEGSYSSDPKNPYARIIELKKMISSLHGKGLRVVMDVVYNHVYNYESSSFEKICPNYYFRFNEDGSLSNGSFCGNEFESRHKMGRKFIVDSCLYWVKEYGIDGFRFDLMGLIDIDTMNEIESKCRKIKPDFLIYGEGWDMPTCMAFNQRANMYNAHLLPHIGFFNDRYRDISKGRTSSNDLFIKGYLSGDINYRDGFKHILTGSTIPLAFPPLFMSPSQSINYVECHDNATLYDKLKVCCFDEKEEDIFRRVKLINAVNVFACGVSFIHMGQEIGLSKEGNNNSYNAGDKINQFKWSLLDERCDLYNFFKSCIKVKKKYRFFKLKTKEEIEKSLDFINLDRGGLQIHFINKNVIKPFNDVRIMINPTKEPIEVQLDDYYQLIFNATGEITAPVYVQHVVINGLSLLILVK